jgi:hypothetical protein
MRSIIVAALATALLAPSAAAQTPPQSLTVAPSCYEDDYGTFYYGMHLRITGLGPWGPGQGYFKTPDGFELGPVGFSGDANGVYDTTGFDSLLPGVFVLKIYQPFVATERLYVDCGRPLPVKRAACKRGGWLRWGFDNKRACFRWGRTARECAAARYTGSGTGIEPCPPRLPNE